MEQRTCHRRRLVNSPDRLVKNLLCVCREPAGLRPAPSRCPASAHSHRAIIVDHCPQPGTRWALGGHRGYFTQSFRGYIRREDKELPSLVTTTSTMAVPPQRLRLVQLHRKLARNQGQHSNLVAALAVEEGEQAGQERRQQRYTWTPRHPILGLGS